MKILLTSPYNRKYQAQYFYAKSLKELGHEVKVFWYNKLLGNNTQPNNKVSLGFTKLANNIKLRKIVNQFHPDIFIYNTGSDIISPLTVKKIKQKNCKTVLLSGDSPVKLLNTNYEKKYLKYFDFVFVSDDKHKKEWQKLGAKNVINLPIFGIDPDFHKSLKVNNSEINKFSSDVCFVGSLFQDRQDNLIQIIKLLPKDISIKIWGYILPDTPLDERLKSYYQGLVWEEDMIKVFSSTKIALNFIPFHMNTGNMRTFEIPACKTLQLASGVNTNWYTPENEIVLFSNPRQAAKKIQFYLFHSKERNKIAQAGYKRTIKQHTYQNIFSKLIDIVTK